MRHVLPGGGALRCQHHDGSVDQVRKWQDWRSTGACTFGSGPTLLDAHLMLVNCRLRLPISRRGSNAVALRFNAVTAGATSSSHWLEAAIRCTAFVTATA